MTTSILEIDNLTVAIADKPILQNVSLQINHGEVHAIMGPNGSGKSTLANVLAGKPGYHVQSGSITFLDQDLLALSPNERALAGLFLGFQYPVEIAGVSNINLLKAALNAKRKQQQLPEIDAMDFLSLVKEKVKALDMDEDFLYRSFNAGFSGGEKKRNEILQLSILEPVLAVLDEIDSGLDIDALKIVADGVNRLKHPMRSFLLITHYQRLLNYISPDVVHVMRDGKIVTSGDHRLALTLEEKGYGWLADTTATN